MIALNETQVRQLKVGDDVIYKERSGSLNPYWLRARVVGKYPHFVTLSVAANKDFRDSYEDAKNYFTTSFCYNDGIEFGGYRLYKETINDFLKGEVYTNVRGE